MIQFFLMKELIEREEKGPLNFSQKTFVQLYLRETEEQKKKSISTFTSTSFWMDVSKLSSSTADSVYLTPCRASVNCNYHWLICCRSRNQLQHNWWAKPFQHCSKHNSDGLIKFFHHDFLKVLPFCIFCTIMMCKRKCKKN